MLEAPGTWPYVVHVSSLECKPVKGAGAVTSAWRQHSGCNYCKTLKYFPIKTPVHMVVGEENKDNGSGPTVPDWDIVITETWSLTNSVIIHSERSENSARSSSPGPLMRQRLAPSAKQSPLGPRSGRTVPRGGCSVSHRLPFSSLTNHFPKLPVWGHRS